MVIPYVLLAAIAITSKRRKRAIPGGISSASVINTASDQNGQQDRPPEARVISNRRRNCARCISR